VIGFQGKETNNLLEVYKKIKTKLTPDEKFEIQYINIAKDEAVKDLDNNQHNNEQQPVVQYRPATTLGKQSRNNKKKRYIVLFNQKKQIRILKQKRLHEPDPLKVR
jgi:hypothetical protein